MTLFFALTSENSVNYAMGESPFLPDPPLNSTHMSQALLSSSEVQFLLFFLVFRFDEHANNNLTIV